VAAARAARARARELLERFARLDPDATTDSLPVAQMQRLEIAPAPARGANVLILDEPTAVLAPSEVDELSAVSRACATRARASC
jgi:simple sugar transport system ATP-binding protein